MQNADMDPVVFGMLGHYLLPSVPGREPTAGAKMAILPFVACKR